MAAGAELISIPRGKPTLSPRWADQLEVTVELEDPSPDESILWSHDQGELPTGELEDRLSGEVSVDEGGFIWNFPLNRQSAARSDASGEEETDLSKEEPQRDDGPTVDRDNISWFDWDEDDLV
jgi:hypothetical protein